MNNFRTYAYLRASTKEQNADRAKGSLQQFASEHDLVISTFLYHLAFQGNAPQT
jgi:DNA invertase Pin-like site-specific DNA recombinase